MRRRPPVSYLEVTGFAADGKARRAWYRHSEWSMVFAMVGIGFLRAFGSVLDAAGV